MNPGHSSFLLFLCGVTIAFAQGQFRRHSATEARPLDLEAASRTPPGNNACDIQVRGMFREIRSNAIPDHKVGRFPNAGNPHSISEQDQDFRLQANPVESGRTTAMDLGPTGIAVNGVLFDPGAAEFWQGNPGSGWTYEALGGAVPLGLDENHAHVQPTGKYHYHGLPTLLLEDLKVTAGKHSPIVGWAADGFPIYALYGYEDTEDEGSQVVELKSSYRLKAGDRPGGREPDGKYDGAFVQDYEYVDGLGDLDECNGRQTITPDFPEGTYAYFLTKDWPVIPRQLKGTPENLRGEERGGPGRGPGPGGMRPPRGGPGQGRFPPPGGGPGRDGPPPRPRDDN